MRIKNQSLDNKTNTSSQFSASEVASKSEMDLHICRGRKCRCTTNWYWKQLYSRRQEVNAEECGTNPSQVTKLSTPLCLLLHTIPSQIPRVLNLSRVATKGNLRTCLCFRITGLAPYWRYIKISYFKFQLICVLLLFWTRIWSHIAWQSVYSCNPDLTFSGISQKYMT